MTFKRSAHDVKELVNEEERLFDLHIPIPFLKQRSHVTRTRLKRLYKSHENLTKRLIQVNKSIEKARKHLLYLDLLECGIVFNKFLISPTDPDSLFQPFPDSHLECLKKSVKSSIKHYIKDLDYLDLAYESGTLQSPKMFHNTI